MPVGRQGQLARLPVAVHPFHRDIQVPTGTSAVPVPPIPTPLLLDGYRTTRRDKIRRKFIMEYMLNHRAPLKVSQIRKILVDGWMRVAVTERCHATY
jgi:hypothetical protein